MDPSHTHLSGYPFEYQVTTSAARAGPNWVNRNMNP
jgi:hypothetical protein